MTRGCLTLTACVVIAGLFEPGACRLAAAADSCREWALEADGFFKKGPLWIYAAEQNGEWLSAVGSSRSKYNANYYHVDLSGVPVRDGVMKGRLSLGIPPDPWMPPDKRPVELVVEVDARVKGNQLDGTYKVVSHGSSRGGREFKDRVGRLRSTGRPTAKPASWEKATYQLQLHRALLTGSAKPKDRCLVLELGFDGDALVSAVSGRLSTRREVFGMSPVEPLAVDVRKTPYGFEGRVSVRMQTLDMAPAACVFELTCSRFKDLCVGRFKMNATVEGEKTVEHAGFFDGRVKRGAEPLVIDKRPWCVPVGGFRAPAPCEHPRLLFRRSDLPALRTRAATPEGQAILKRLRQTLDGADGTTLPANLGVQGKVDEDGAGNLFGAPVGEVYTIGHGVGYGLLYQVTGEKRYAELCRKAIELGLEGWRGRDRRYAFRHPFGALRAGPALGWMAVAYDLGYDAWDAQTRERFGRAIAEYDEGGDSNLEALARGSKPPQSNHFGMQVGGAALALLAVTGEPFVDQARVDRLLGICAMSMTRNLSEGFGDGGFFAEGDGTGSMSSQIAFIPALNAWKLVKGYDYINVERPNARMMTLKWIYLTVSRGGAPVFWPRRGGYPQNVWARGGISGGGYFAMGMSGVTEAQQGAMKWYYETFLDEHDRKAGIPFDTASVFPHLSVCSFVNWPLGKPSVNPADVLPLCYRDTRHEFVAWRNRWQDGEDIVISVILKETDGYMKAKREDSLQVLAGGRRARWGEVDSEVKHWWTGQRGALSVLTTGKGSIAVDLSGASGAEVMLATTGRGEGQNVKLGDTTVTFLFLPAEPAPPPRVEGGHIVVGKQKLVLEGANLAFK